MSRILVILDGAPEPVGKRPTSLDVAVTPALDALCAEGEVGRLRTTPEGFAPGSETGIPMLLGVAPAEPAGRGWIEAAAAGVSVRETMGAWRLDLRHPGGRRASESAVRRRICPLLRGQLPEHDVMPLRGHRVLAVGAERPRVERCGGLDVVVWPDGARLAPGETASLSNTTLICGPGAAAGIGRLLGARVVVPFGATGDTDSDLGAKAVAALLALGNGDDVVVHVGAPDEAAHRGEWDAKRRAIEAADRRLVALLRTAARRAGARLAVTADHGTCPWTGRHDRAPVPFVVAGPGIAARGSHKLSERAVSGAPVDETLSPEEAVA